MPVSLLALCHRYVAYKRCPRVSVWILHTCPVWDSRDRYAWALRVKAERRLGKLQVDGMFAWRPLRPYAVHVYSAQPVFQSAHVLNKG